MAVAHVQFASQINTSFTNTVTVTLGSAPTTGNVLLFLAACDYDDPDNFETPTGFTKLDPEHNIAVGQLTSSAILSGLQVWYRVVESGDGTSYTATYKSNRYLTGVMVEVSGAGTPVMRSAPFSSSSGVFFSGQDATVQSTSYAFMAAHSRDGSSWTVTTPTGFTELLDDPTTGNNSSIWCGYDIGATTIDDLSVTSGGTYLCGMLVEIPESGTTLTPWDGANFVTVKPSGGNYTTFTAAIADTDIRNGVYQAQWASNSAFTSNTTITLPTAVQPQTSYKRHLHITAAPANRHSGVAGTSHARVETTGHPFVMNYGQAAEWTRISHLELKMLSNNAAVRSYQSNMILLDNLIINGGSVTGDEGIDVDQYGSSRVVIANCVFHGPSFASWGAVRLQGTNGQVPSVIFQHCSINGLISVTKTGYIASYNTWWGPAVSNKAIFRNGTDANHASIDGFNNVHGPNGGVDSTFSADATRNWYEAASLTSTTTTADAIIVTDTTSGSENYTPVAATGSGSNVILGAGSNVQCAPADPRLDLSVDIAGNARPTTNVDIGAFQISTGDAAAATGTGIQVYTGSEWVNANAIQYYDGEWT